MKCNHFFVVLSYEIAFQYNQRCYSWSSDFTLICDPFCYSQSQKKLEKDCKKTVSMGNN